MEPEQQLGPQTRRRSSRSSSRPPVMDGQVVVHQGAEEMSVVKITQFRSVVSQETVIQEGQSSTSAFTEQTFTQSDSSVVHQNQQNEKLVASTLEATTSQPKSKVRRSVPALHSNGSSTKRVRKSTLPVLAEVPHASTSKSASSESGLASAKRSTRTAVKAKFSQIQQAGSSSSADSGEARRLYEAMLSGTLDGSKSVFMRFYKPLQEWWNHYPKTDYTYSPLSRCRRELAPGMIVMPNLSRPGVRTRSMIQQSWLGYESDPEEWERTDLRSKHRQGWMKRTFSSTLTVITTVMRFMYIYTIGAVLGLFTRTGGAGTSLGSKSSPPLLLRPFMWLATLTRSFLLMEAWIIAWLGSGQRRNWLLGLLLLLLLGVPIYVLYSGSAEKAQLVDESASGVLAWLKRIPFFFSTWFFNLSDFLNDALLGASSVATFCFGWLLSCISSLVGWAWNIICFPFVVIGWFFTWVPSNFWILFYSNSSSSQEATHSSNQAMQHNQQDLPIENSLHGLLMNGDLELLAKRIVATEAFSTSVSGLKEDKKVPELQASLLTALHTIEDLKAKVNNLQLGLSGHQSQQYMANDVRRDLRTLERKVKFLQVHHSRTDKSCCEKLEQQIATIMSGLFGADGKSADNVDLAAYLHAKFAAIDEIASKLNKVSDDLGLHQGDLTSLKKDIDQMQKLRGKTSGEAIEIASVPDDRVRDIVREILAVYDADKTNMVDYALETSGGTILSTRCTESYDFRSGVTFYFGLSWFGKSYRPNNPRTIIQPSVHPGECWAFKGATGYVVIELSSTIQILAVSMEHIPRTLSPHGKIDSAPKDFSIWGLVELVDPEPLPLGQFRYEDNGQPIQTFAVEAEHISFRRIELRIESNHGNLEYTCVYRFRVHGIPAPN